MKRSVADLELSYRDDAGNVHTTKAMSAGAANKLNNSAATDAGLGDLIDKNLLSQVQTRFNGLKQNSDYAFILAKGTAGTELVKVRKKDGKEVATIALATNKPIYEIDPIDGSLYYAEDATLKIYRDL